MNDWKKIDLKGKMSGQIKTICPSCIDINSKKKGKSLSVNIDRGVAKCHRCSETFFKDKKAKEENINYEVPKQDWTNFTDISDNVVRWFDSRGISQITIQDFNIGEKLVFFPSADKKLNGITFNYFMDGTVVSEHYRSGNKDFTQMKNAVKSPYNIDSIKDHDYAIISEGEMDTMSWHEVGLESCVGVDGASHFGVIEAFKGSFDGKKIYLATDKDYVGIELEKQIISLFGKSRCYRMDYPDNLKDINEVLVKHGKEAVLNVFENATNVALIGDVIEDNDNMNYHLEKYYNGDIRKGMALGLGTKFDNDIVFRDNAFHMIVGLTSIGKSIISFWMMVKLAQLHDVKIIIYSSENANAFIKGTLISYFLADSDKYVYLNNKDKWSRAAKFIEEHFILLNNTEGWGLQEILGKAAAIKESYGADFLLIDPWNNIKMVKPEKNMGDYAYQVWGAAELLRFSKSTMSVILNSHAITSVGRGSEPPTLYSVEGGGIFANKVDVGIVFHREIGHVDVDERNTTSIWSVKARDNRIFGGDITPKEEPHKLRYGLNDFKLIKQGLYTDEEIKSGNYV